MIHSYSDSFPDRFHQLLNSLHNDPSSLRPRLRAKKSDQLIKLTRKPLQILERHSTSMPGLDPVFYSVCDSRLNLQLKALTNIRWRHPWQPAYQARPTLWSLGHRDPPRPVKLFECGEAKVNFPTQLTNQIELNLEQLAMTRPFVEAAQSV